MTSVLGRVVIPAMLVIGSSFRIGHLSADEPKPKAVLHGHEYSAYSVAFSPDGKALASAGQDGRALVWNLTTGELSVSLEGHKYGVSAIAFSPDGRTVATAGDRDDIVCLWDRATGKQLARHRFSADSVAFSPDGKTLAAVGGTESGKGQVKLGTCRLEKNAPL